MILFCLIFFCVFIFLFFFFFSSRRRHTRFDCDWSSDVCSSDLEADRAPSNDRQQIPARVEEELSRSTVVEHRLRMRRRRSEERRVGKECRSRWSPYH